MSDLTRMSSLLGALAVVIVVAGCVSSARYGELKQEVKDLRYQYRLEHLYVAGLKVQNRQLQQQKRELLSEFETAGQRMP
jgi:outer membrane murein-binding lipoprotein Lpp